MIVYRDQRTPADPRRLLTQVESAASRSCTSAFTHDDAVELVIEAGNFESAVVDALFPVFDGIHPLARALRGASIEAGHVLWHTWHGNQQQAGRWGERLRLTLAAVPADQLPRSVEVSVPEGYAYYAVYPEMYLEAARRFALEGAASDVVCLGIRSIGSSLCAVVSAALEELGTRVRSWTLRPRGHPFSRRPLVSDELARLLPNPPGAYFLVIDEGPGISGSSMSGIAGMLQQWGIEDDHVLLFPSWQTDGSHLASAEARERWPRYRQFTTSFEEVWVNSGRLDGEFSGELRNLSAGAWRQHVYRELDDYPAVQPQHERRKYLTDNESDPPRLVSFAGLGKRTANRVERLARLAESGFTIGPERLVHGFLVRPFVTGTPLSADQVDLELVERVAEYLAHLAREHSAEPSVDDASLREMVDVNVGEGLRLSAPQQAVFPADGWVERPVALDGRMLAHEWVRTPGGILKLDAMDHHDDHFFPGVQDIAWDVAAAVYEFGLAGGRRTHLVDRYRRLSGDRSITRRLHHYGVAYLAFRLGYATLASELLGQTDDGIRFAHQARRYGDLLTTELTAPRGCWNG